MTKKTKKTVIAEKEITEDALTNNHETVEQLIDENDNVSETNSEELTEKYNNLNDSYLRLNAEFDNYRKRTLKEKSELIKTGGERIIADFLPIIDDFDRAIENMDKSEDVTALKEGVDLIYGKFISFLTKHGVKEIATIGEVFDVEKHEALTTIPAPSEDMKDKIIDCVQKGYTLEDKVIRYPKVVVAK